MRLAIAALGMGVLAGLASAQDRPNRLTAVEASEGWILLFDGKSLDGWEPHAGGDFKVEDGAISCPGTTAGWISTSRSFSDYALKLEFRGAAKGEGHLALVDKNIKELIKEFEANGRLVKTPLKFKLDGEVYRQNYAQLAAKKAVAV